MYVRKRKVWFAPQKPVSVQGSEGLALAAVRWPGMVRAGAATCAVGLLRTARVKRVLLRYYIPTPSLRLREEGI